MKILSSFLSFSKSSKAVVTLLAEIGIGIGLVLTCLGLFFSIAEDIVTNDTISFDATLVHYVYTFRTPLLTDVMLGLSFIGGQGILGIALIAIIIFLFWKDFKKDGLIFSFILVFGALLNIALKDLFHRPRPTYLPLVHESTYSFPSGHAMNSFIFYTCLSYFIFLKFKNRFLKYFLITLSFILIFLIGLSRVYLGAHYPSDVIAGFAAGLIWFGLVVLFEKTIEVLNLFRAYEKMPKI